MGTLHEARYAVSHFYYPTNELNYVKLRN